MTAGSRCRTSVWHATWPTWAARRRGVTPSIFRLRLSRPVAQSRRLPATSTRLASRFTAYSTEMPSCGQWQRMLGTSRPSSPLASTPTVVGGHHTSTTPCDAWHVRPCTLTQRDDTSQRVSFVTPWRACGRRCHGDTSGPLPARLRGREATWTAQLAFGLDLGRARDGAMCLNSLAKGRAAPSGRAGRTASPATLPVTRPRTRRLCYSA